MESNNLDTSWMKLWQEWLNDDEVSPDERSLVTEFFIPYKIDWRKYYANLDAFSQQLFVSPFYFEPAVGKSATPSIKRIIENPELFTNPIAKSMKYPKWFYLAFPDVAIWSTSGLGYAITKVEILHLPEEMIFDHIRNQMLETNLKGIIELFILRKFNKRLECSVQEDFLSTLLVDQKASILGSLIVIANSDGEMNNTERKSISRKFQTY